MSEAFEENQKIPPELLDMDQVLIDPSFALKVPPGLALRKQIIPITLNNEKVYVACPREDIQAINLIQRYFEFPIELKLAEETSLKRALERVYGGLSSFTSSKNSGEKSRTTGEEDGERAVDLSEEVLHSGVLRNASDIHLVPHENTTKIQLRINGYLEDYRDVPKSLHAGLVSRFKVLGGLDISEKRAPQDGAFPHQSGNKKFDVRIATIPTQYGERVTLRLLGLNRELLSLEHLGMNFSQREQFQSIVENPHGLVLITGPTGSGKTTTLYAAIQHLLQHRKLNIITVEDPVEYKIPEISQVKVDTGDKVSFQKALRSLLRHDPDVVVIGEIRDHETIEVAIRGALTGHLVLSTLHTNSAIGTITRMEDMGVPRYLIASTLKAALAQRLVRKSCAFCLQEVPLTEAKREMIPFPEKDFQSVFEPQGCLHCCYRGFVGRIGLFELLKIDELWAQRINAGMKEIELIESMKTQQIPLLKTDGMNKIIQGQTTCEEVFLAVAS